ncbi:conserved hypothetical protein [Trichinella spiralis]|uniref:hypothetical protein n=1 Tax=Trichinella spiralis TaxID=6334 RepID=UPI0001EFBE18|nr:conserved hypothetical protein [Trichinella spiralis]
MNYQFYVAVLCLALCTEIASSAATLVCGKEIFQYFECMTSELSPLVNNSESSEKFNTLSKDVELCFTTNGCQKPEAILLTEKEKYTDVNDDDDDDDADANDDLDADFEEVTVTKVVLNPKLFPGVKERTPTPENDKCMVSEDQESNIIMSCIKKTIPDFMYPDDDMLIDGDFFLESVKTRFKRIYLELEDGASYYLKTIREGKKCPAHKAGIVEKCVKAEFEKRQLNPFRNVLELEEDYAMWCKTDKKCTDLMNNECKEKLKKLPQTFCACAKEKSPEIVQQLRRTYKKCYDADAAEEQVKKIIMRKTKSECDEYKRIWNFCKSDIVHNLLRINGKICRQ